VPGSVVPVSVAVGSVDVVDVVGSEVVGGVLFVGSMVEPLVSAVLPPVESAAVVDVVPESAGHAVRVPSPVARARSFKVVRFMYE